MAGAGGARSVSEGAAGPPAAAVALATASGSAGPRADPGVGRPSTDPPTSTGAGGAGRPTSNGAGPRPRPWRPPAGRRPGRPAATAAWPRGPRRSAVSTSCHWSSVESGGSPAAARRALTFGMGPVPESVVLVAPPPLLRPLQPKGGQLGRLAERGRTPRCRPCGATGRWPSAGPSRPRTGAGRAAGCGPPRWSPRTGAGGRLW